ncbi:conserved hypothetical protein [Oleispira antarctica RB-8]|uniref:Dual OB-containing domain-containing protein n=1 Tax=Oleispira antarctica RB-8 TaxID=698738 RepID=R4YT36_OLEAN|nr:conserved hypothetical protein [Oleispira antarctica RB-8]
MFHRGLNTGSSVDIVVLAKSFKHGEHCIAGKCLITKEWIRPVSDINGGAISSDQAKIQNKYGIFPTKPLQKIQIKINQHTPLINQPENHLIQKEQWIQKYSVKNHELINYLDIPDSLWGRGNHVSYASIQNGTQKIDQSLYLVQVKNLNLIINEDGKKRAIFDYNNEQYNLPVTDPQFNKILEQRPELASILCISLACEFHNKCYKVVATIF